MTNPRDVIVGVDLGGTSMRALVVDADYQVLGEDKQPTNPKEKPVKLIADLANVVEQAVERAGLKMKEVRAVSIGAPGAVDSERGIVFEAPNIRWRDVRLGAKLRKTLQVPVLVENDVNVGVVGEHVLGAGRGTKELVGIFVGTGIGGGIISRGRLYEGCRGSAGEIGHVVIQADGPRCGCGKRGCAEALASRTAMERDVRAEIKAGHKSQVLEIMKARNRDRMTSNIVVRALRKRDRVMRKVMARAEHYLGILVANIVNILDPECVVIGGGLAERLQEDFVGPIRKTAYHYFLQQRGFERVSILPGQLGDQAGALGAAVLARQRLRHTS